MTNNIDKKVLDANIKYHTSLAATYNQDQPHFKAENIARVDAILADLAAKTGGNSLLDLGCGTGFIINIAKKYFKRVVGVDITPAMLSQVERANGQIEIFEANTENMAFLDSNSFDVCTGYSFLHHLYDFGPTLKEVYRVLRPGGVLYSDQDPNSYYYRLIDEIKNYDELPSNLKREIQYVINSFDEAVRGKDITVNDVDMAEYHDISKGGMDASLLITLLHEIGFKTANCRYEWYAGQGQVIHNKSQETANMIEEYLREILPASRSLFKYFAVFAEK